MKQSIKTKKIFLCRHGESQANEKNIWSGQRIDAELTEAGKKQAMLLGEKLSRYSIDAVYASPLIRACQTAEIAADFLKLPYSFDPRLKEANYGQAEGCSFDEVREKWPGIREYWINPVPMHFDARFPGGESLRDVQDRAWQALKELVENNDYYHIAVVTHAGVICSLLSSLFVLFPRIKNCQVFPLVYEKKTFRVGGKIF